jgi:hypothetical protein
MRAQRANPGTKVVQGILSKALVLCVLSDRHLHTPPRKCTVTRNGSSFREFGDGTTAISSCHRPGQSYRLHSK